MTIEGLMILPIALIVILLGRFLLEASLNRQETAVYARGSAINAAVLWERSLLGCRFDEQDFTGRPSVAQSGSARCERRDAEQELSREQPIWDALDEAADPWSEILRDVRPRTGPRDVIATTDVTLTMTAPTFLAEQAPVEAQERHLAPERRYWGHSEGDFAEGHDRVIWDELCREATWQLFPNIFPSRGRNRC